MRRRLRAGPVDRLALAHKNLNGTPQGSLQRSQRYLAVALQPVAVSDGKQPARNLHRQIQNGSHDQLFVVEIPPVRVRSRTRLAVDSRGRRDSNSAPKRSELQPDSRRKFRRTSLGIHTNLLESGIGKFIGKRSTTGPE